MAQTLVKGGSDAIDGRLKLKQVSLALLHRKQATQREGKVNDTSQVLRVVCYVLCVGTAKWHLRNLARKALQQLQVKNIWLHQDLTLNLFALLVLFFLLLFPVLRV